MEKQSWFVIQRDISRAKTKENQNRASEGVQTLNSEGEKKNLKPSNNSKHNIEAPLQHVGSHEPTGRKSKRPKSSFMEQSDLKN